MTRLGALLLLAGLGALPATAATLLQVVDATTAENWNTGSLWQGGDPPTTGNDYDINGHILRAHGFSTGSNVFGGDLLLVTTGSQLQSRSGGTWSANVVLSGGSLTTGVSDGAIMILQGTMLVDADSTLQFASSNDNVTFQFDTALSGVERFTISSGGAGNRVIINNPASTFSGAYRVLGANTLAFGFDAATDSLISLGSTGLLDLDHAIAARGFERDGLDLSGLPMFTALSYSDLVTFNNALAANLIDGGGTLTIVPEPATGSLLLLSLAGLGVVRRLRERRGHE